MLLGRNLNCCILLTGILCRYARINTYFLALPEEQERSQICFTDLGCFQSGYPFDTPVFERIISLAPDDRTEIGTEFRFYAPKRNGHGQFITNLNFTNWDIADSGFNASAKTKFIIHGYQGGNAEWAKELKQAFIIKEGCNVFIVDWTNGASTNVYEQAVANVRVAGAETGLFILKLMNETGVTPRNIHIIGHSLGSHGSGYAGKFIQMVNKTAKIGRITGLDPAGPYFNGVLPAVRLDQGDAYFVDVIHTNVAGNRLSGFGLEEPIGHFDYYPNGGEDQPGCPTAGEAAWEIVKFPASYAYQNIIGATEAPFQDRINGVSCSHGRAYEYFIQSVWDRECSFDSLQCFSWERYLAGECGSCRDHHCIAMGYYAERYTRYAKGRSKMFYLRTAQFPPYCCDTWASSC